MHPTARLLVACTITFFSAATAVVVAVPAAASSVKEKAVSPEWRAAVSPHYRYTAKNRFSSASGAYQFLDKQWRRGLVYMMLAESRKTNDGLSEQIRSLFDQPITTWDRYFQDRAFYTAYAHGKGAAHWSETCPV